MRHKLWVLVGSANDPIEMQQIEMVDAADYDAAKACAVGWANEARRLENELHDLNVAYQESKARIAQLEAALLEIAATTKGYPNGSREGQIAIAALKALGIALPWEQPSTP